VPSVLPLFVARPLIPHRTLFFKAKDLVCIIEKRLRDCAGCICESVSVFVLLQFLQVEIEVFGSFAGVMW
jgi:hypothetical protein